MDMPSNPPSTSPPKSPSADPKESSSYLTLKKTLSGAGVEARPLPSRTRSRSDTWSPASTGFRHDGDAPVPTSTHCWQCGAALISQMTSKEKAPSLSPTSRLPLLSQRNPAEVQAPPVSADNHSDTPGNPNTISFLSQTDKLMRMKDAMLDATDIPVIALWQDESLAVPNKAIVRMMHFDPDSVSDEVGDVLSRYRVFTEDFDRELEQHEFPIVKLCRTQQPFSRVRVGIMDSQSRQRILEVIGQCIYDEKTGDFQAAVCAFKDVTWYTELLKAQSEQNEQNEQQFQLICETLPQMVCSLSWLVPRCLGQTLSSDNSYGLLPQRDGWVWTPTTSLNSCAHAP